jgi:hypothetical protein
MNAENTHLTCESARCEEDRSPSCSLESGIWDKEADLLRKLGSSHVGSKWNPVHSYLLLRSKVLISL